MKIARHAGFILLAFVAFANGNEGWAGPCDTCAKIEQKLAEFRGEKEDLARLLERNRLFLEQLRRKGPVSPSVEIKASSNSFMIAVKKETIENHEQGLNKLFAKFNCSRCPSGKK